jgi:hypothetical protein
VITRRKDARSTAGHILARKDGPDVFLLRMCGVFMVKNERGKGLPNEEQLPEGRLLIPHEYWL